MDITALAVIKALDGLLLRQTVTASNVANANSEGFVPSKVSFEEGLQRALASANPQAVANVPLSQSLQMNEGALGKVRLDQEVANMTQTTLQYQLLINMLDARLSTMKLALDDGKAA